MTCSSYQHPSFLAGHSGGEMGKIAGYVLRSCRLFQIQLSPEFSIQFFLFSFNLVCSLVKHRPRENTSASNCFLFLSSHVFMPLLSQRLLVVKMTRAYWFIVLFILFIFSRGYMKWEQWTACFDKVVTCKWHTWFVCLGGYMCTCWSKFVWEEVLSSKQPKAVDLWEIACKQWISFRSRKDEE